jgi:LmbE family N-acetylglucosaminyl deacetylase
MHVFLSPHFDDVAFSCGARMAALQRQGQPVAIFTVMGGAPNKQQPANAFIEEIIRRWGLGDSWQNIADKRQQEDAAAAAALGVMAFRGPFSDALFRTDAAGNWLYASQEALFGPLQHGDPVQAKDIAEIIGSHLAQAGLQASAFYAPLAVGHHVDHQLVRQAAMMLAKNKQNLSYYFYEDYPYMRQGRPVLVQALNELAQPLLRVVYQVEETDLAAKIAASSCYTSQISTFWPDLAALDAELRAYHEASGGESFWRLLRPDDFPDT